MVLLVLGIFGWTLYSIVSYDDYYYGEPLQGLDVVVKESPKFSFDGETKISYYYFTVENYKAEFRVSEGAVKLVRKSDSLTSKIEAIKGGDSVKVDIRKSDYQKLVLENKNVRVIGLSVKGQKLIDPSEVQEIEKGNKADRWFSYCVFFGILLFMIAKEYLKRRKQNRAASTPACYNNGFRIKAKRKSLFNYVLNLS